MNKNDILFIFHSPHGSWGLRHRASKLPKGNQYKLLLEALAKALDEKRINKNQSKKIIEYWRSGKPDLAVKMFEVMKNE